MTPSVISHYRLLEPLGEGGMGVVYRAEDVRLGREVAVKLLRSDAVGSASWLERFEREARLESCRTSVFAARCTSWGARRTRG